MRVTLLGCGGSGGVPLPGVTAGGHWGECDPRNPKNRRLRVSVLVETRDKLILIDASPDLREQIIAGGITRLDALLITHAHADHCHGIDDLRTLSYAAGRAIPTYMTEDTRRQLTGRFDYIFTSSHRENALYPALLEDRSFGYGTFEAAGVPVTAFRQGHGNVESVGFRIGNFAYSTDVKSLDEEAFETLKGLDLWIVDCLRFAPHPTHAHFDLTMEWIGRVKPRHAVLTHMNHMVDYEAIRQLCPAGVEPGFDGLTLALPDHAQASRSAT